VENNIFMGELAVAPYGGMFFHKNLIKTIGYPNINLYLYADDHEWSYRINKNGGKIYLCWKSKVEDIELSWHVEKKRLTVFDTLIMDGSDFRVYYGVRNRTYFEKKDLVTNHTVYKINLLTFRLILFFYALIKKKLNRYFLIKKAIEDGLKGNLGRSL